MMWHWETRIADFDYLNNCHVNTEWGVVVFPTCCSLASAYCMVETPQSSGGASIQALGSGEPNGFCHVRASRYIRVSGEPSKKSLLTPLNNEDEKLHLKQVIL